jgi:hypothetical protein
MKLQLAENDSVKKLQTWSRNKYIKTIAQTMLLISAIPSMYTTIDIMYLQPTVKHEYYLATIPGIFALHAEQGENIMPDSGDLRTRNMVLTFDWGMLSLPIKQTGMDFNFERADGELLPHLEISGLVG